MQNQNGTSGIKFTKAIKRLIVGQEISFDKVYYDTVTSVTTRLKRTGAGLFQNRISGDQVMVRRLTDATIYPSQDPQQKKVRKYRDAISDLEWQTLQYDPNSQTCQLFVAISQAGGSTHRIYFPVTDIPAFFQTLITHLKQQVLISDN